jgi:hypothetical protein
MLLPGRKGRVLMSVCLSNIKMAPPAKGSIEMDGMGRYEEH